MRLYDWETLLRNLAGVFDVELHPRVFRFKDEALAELKRVSGQDFGYDVNAWLRYVEESGSPRNAFPGLYPKHSADSPNEPC